MPLISPIPSQESSPTLTLLSSLSSTTSKATQYEWNEKFFLKLKPRSQFRSSGTAKFDERVLILKNGRAVPLPEFKTRQINFGLQEHKKYSTDSLGKCSLAIKGSMLNDLIKEGEQYRWFTLDNRNESVGIKVALDNALSRQDQTKPLDSIYHDYKLRTKWQLLVRLSLTSSECAPFPLVQGLKDFEVTNMEEPQASVKRGGDGDHPLEKRRQLQHDGTGTIEAKIQRVKREGWGTLRILGGDDNDGPDELEQIGQEMADKLQANAFVPGGYQIGVHVSKFEANQYIGVTDEISFNLGG